MDQTYTHRRLGPTRRLLAVLATLMLLAAACGGSDDEEASSSASEASESASAMSESASSSEPSESASSSEPSESASSSETAEPTLVTVADVTGDVEVPQTADGVYALDEFAGIALMTLGVEPIAIEGFFEDVALGSVVESEGIELAASGNVEAIAVASPSLILGIGHPIHLENREAHLGIAPTATPDFTQSWIFQTEQFAEATGTQERAGQVVGAVNARIEELAGRVEAEGLAGSEISMIQQFGAEYYAYGPTTLVGQLVEQVGFIRSEVQSGGGEFGFILVAEELLAEETDAPIVIAIDVTGQPTTIFDSPIVSTEGKTSAKVIDTWTGNHALAAWVILDDLESILFGDGTVTELDDVPAVWSDLVAAIDASDSVEFDATPEPEAAPTNVLEAGGANGATTISQFAAFSPGFNGAVTGDGPVTAFLPDDAALAGLDASIADALRADFELLDAVLSYHAVGESLNAEAVIAAGEIVTVSGETITVTVDGDAVILNDGQATVSIADIEAPNGIAHVIDGVLLPPSAIEALGL